MDGIVFKVRCKSPRIGDLRGTRHDHKDGAEA
jgi:hypothetical protein